MSSNKFTKFVKSINYYKNILPNKYKPYYDIVTNLYIERKIEKQSELRKLLDKFMSRGNGPKSAIKLIEDKYIHQLPVKGIKEKYRNFHIT